LTDPAHAADRVSARELLVACVPCLVLAALIRIAWPVDVDDAFISFRHAYNWVAHGNLSFDPVQRIEGYSNFAQVAFAAALLARGVDPLAPVKWIGALSGLLCVPLGYLLARRVGVRHPFALLGALLISLDTGLAFWSASGLETSFHTLLLTGGVLLFLRRRPASDLAGAAVFALAGLNRVEAPVLVGAVGLWRIAVEHLEGRRLGRIARDNAAWAALFLGLYGAYFVWRVHYFGHWFPNPVYFKRATSLGGLGDSHTAAFLRSAWPLLLLAAASIGAREQRNGLPLLVVAVSLGVFATARVEVLGDVSTMGFYDRYFVPVLPCLVASAMLALDRASRAIPAGSPLRLAVAGVAVALVVWQLVNPEANPLHLVGRARSYPPAVRARNVTTAQYLQDRFGSGGFVVAGDVGRLGYGFKGRVGDLFGLNSYAFTLDLGGDIERWADALLAGEPDAIVICRDDVTHETCHRAEAVLAGRPAFERDYRAVQSFGREEVPSAYAVVYERRAVPGEGRTSSSARSSR
jgi:arabinofuranosyltransferase